MRNGWKSLAAAALILVPAAGKEKPLKVLIAEICPDRGKAFEDLLRAEGMETERLPWAALSKEKARGFDVALLDPFGGETSAHGQSAGTRAKPLAEPLGVPTVAVGAPGSSAMIPFLLYFGNNG